MTFVAGAHLTFVDDYARPEFRLEVRSLLKNAWLFAPRKREPRSRETQQNDTDRWIRGRRGRFEF